MAKGKATDIKLPNLQNATPAFIIDEIGLIRLKQKILKKLEGVHKEALNAKLPEDYEFGDNIPGEKNFSGKKTIVTQERKDANAMYDFIKRTHGEEVANGFVNVTSYEKITTSLVKEVNVGEVTLGPDYEIDFELPDFGDPTLE